MIASSHVVPPHLVQAILRGRCVAFVGAGFSAAVTPSWPRLLARLAEKLGTGLTVDEKGTAFYFEAVGQHLKDIAGDRLEALVREILDECYADASKEARATLAERSKLLHSIPFKAILTTNYDASLTGEPAEPDTYWNVLRHEHAWWNSAPPRKGGRARTTPVIKLHGDANGNPTVAPLVLGRADYRRRLYDDSSYATFLRAVFAQYTVLFLGVSFTDAYLNELRSEILTVMGSRRDPPWGYAVVNRPRKELVDFFEHHESIRVLADDTDDFTGFDRWLKEIAAETSIEGRLNRLLSGKKIVWVDPNPQNNERGHELLRQSAQVEALRDEALLDEAQHARADVVLTNFGYEGPGSARAYRVLERINRWAERPPVIVFAGVDNVQRLRENRAGCLRRGAAEYTIAWGELYRMIESVLGRAPGDLG